MKSSFIRDKNGKVTLWQSPNPALVGWAGVTVVNHFAHSSQLAWLGTALLFAWASLELYSGVNYFRRLLGLAVLILIIVMKFKG